MTTTAGVASPTRGPTFLTVDAVAAQLLKSQRTIRRWCARGKFEGARQVGRGWQIPPDALASVIATPITEAA